MTSIRCKMAAAAVLDSMNITYSSIDLGKVELYATSSISEPIKKELHIQLKKAGLGLLDEKKAKMVENTKLVIVEMVHYCDTLPSNKIDEYIADKIQCDYKVLSDLFALVTGISIQQYIAIHKTERVKELLLYETLNLKEIAQKLHYKSVEQLTAQFKRQTGLTTTFFAQMRTKRKQLVPKA